MINLAYSSYVFWNSLVFLRNGVYIMFLITFTLWIYLRYLFCVFPIVFYIFNHSTSSKTYILYPPWLDFWETHSSFLRNLFVCNFILCIIVWLTFLPKVVLLCPHVFISYLIVLSVSQHEKTVIYLKRSEKRLRGSVHTSAKLIFYFSNKTEKGNITYPYHIYTF